MRQPNADTALVYAPSVPIAASLAVGVVALLHLGFLVLEMFLWAKPAGRRIFRTTPDFAESSRALAANQGLYNGFLVAGLAWSFVAEPGLARALRFFFLGCVVVAGVFGAATVSPRILIVQALPAAVAIGLVLAAG
jgi:putative membrane protein